VRAKGSRPLIASGQYRFVLHYTKQLRPPQYRSVVPDAALFIDGAPLYELQYATLQRQYTSVPATVLTTAQLFGLTHSTVYVARVRSLGAFGPGKWSSEIEFETGFFNGTGLPSTQTTGVKVAVQNGTRTTLTWIRPTIPGTCEQEDNTLLSHTACTAVLLYTKQGDGKAAHITSSL
jgi:hypothetical protein